ncbi:elongation factor 1-alpha C-terminal domain-related protein, partial [Streptomyces sp. SHP 1-2]|uniref:elongation factor 1-alpha C-terminal domain-related protein n=1 Tax=Streptomyces sp. SHP 1-2 TaxID=2769489 RepID=UPI002240E69A|nr:sulfate adenylyltransferase [Streptomyces sp. SHP 1-2]
YERGVFDRVVRDFAAYAAELDLPGFTPLPVSALVGDNVVDRSDRMAWYRGPALLEHLETVPVSHDLPHRPARLPVQYVIRPRTADHPDYRGYAGQIAAGTFRVGDEVTVLPSGRTTRVSGIDLLGEPVGTAFAPQSVTLLLDDDLDVSRGDLIVPTRDAPPTTRVIGGTVCHVADRPLTVGHRVLVKHGTRTVKAVVGDIPSHPGGLTANDIGRVVVRTAEPLAVDAYADCRRTGAFLLIDPADGTTLAAGMADGSRPTGQG